MKNTFTLLKIVRTLLLALCCMIGAERAMAQYTASLMQKDGYYTALSKDNSGNLYVVRYNGATYQLVKWAGGNPASETVLVSSLAFSSSEYSWSIAVNPDNGDVFVTNPNPATGWEIIRVPGGTGTPVVVQSGYFYAAICLDTNNELLALEWNSAGGGFDGTYHLRRYSANGATLIGIVYNGLPVTTDGTYPFAMDVDSHGNIYITNFYNNSDNLGEPALVKLSYPGYTATPVQTGGRHFSGLYFDDSDHLYTIEQVSPGSPNYRVMKYTDPAGTGTEIYSTLASGIYFYPWGITEINGILYVNDGAATTDINGVGGIHGQLLRLTPPGISVVSVNRVGATPTNAASVQFTVTFSGPAVNVLTDAFTATGVSGASVTAVASVNSSTYTVTVNTGTGSGTLGLTVTGANMGTTVTNAPFSSGQTYTIDRTAPGVASVNVPGNGSYGAGQNLDFTVVYNESVTVDVSGGTPYIPVTIGAATVNASYLSGSGSSGLVFRYTVQAGESDADGIAVGSSITLNGGLMRDMTDNTAGVTLNSIGNTSAVLVDAAPPATTSVNVPASGGYNAGDALSFTVNFNENVIVTGTPSVPVTIGSTTVQATYVSGSGTAALTFKYTVLNGEHDPDGIAPGAAITLNGGTIKDATANNAVLMLNSVGNTSSVIVDAVAPVVTSVAVPANDYYNGGQQLNFTVNFSENVTPSAVPSIPVTIGSTVVEADYVSGSGTNALLFTYTVQPGDMDMDGIAVGSTIALNLGTIKDGVGNDAVLTLNNIANTSNVFVNTSAATVVLSGTPALNASWTMTITFSEAVTSFASGDITATNATVSNLSTSDNITYTVLVTATGDGAVTLNVPANVADNIGGNGNAASNTITYTHDGTAPAVVSVSLPANGTYHAGDVLNLTLNFNENVTVTGTPISPIQIGATVVQAAYAGGSGSSALTFSYTVLNGEEDNDGIGVGDPIDFNGGAIKDAAGNNALNGLAGVGGTTGILVDALAPVISSVTVPVNGYYKAGDALSFTVQFSEPVVSTSTTTTLPVTIGTTTVQAVRFSTPTANSIVFRYVVQTGQMDTDGISVGSAVVAGSTPIRDAAGNPAVPTLNNVGSTSGVFVLASRPSVTFSGAPASNVAWTTTIVFSHAVTGFALSDIALTNAVASDLQAINSTTYTALISPQVQGATSVQIPANVAADMAGNLNEASRMLFYSYDPNPPVITSVEVPANGYYKEGDVLNFAVNWNEAVKVNRTPSTLTLPVIIGANTVQANFVDGFRTARLTFAYTVQAGDLDLDGIQLGTALQITHPDVQFTDMSGNTAILTVNGVPNTSGIFVHTARPSVTLGSAAAARVNAPFTVTLTFNEAVTQLDLADFTLTNATVSNLQTTDNITYTVLVTPVADGAVSISLPADAAVNVVGNGNTASNTITRTHDATPPVITAGQSFTVIQYSAAGTVVGTVTATDASGTVQNWAIATDGSGGALQISAAGVITVKNTSLLNALAGTDVNLGVTLSDGLNTSTAVPVTVRVIFVNQPPTLDVISNLAVCKDVQTHTIQLTGASAVEPGQTYTITATSTSNIFDMLTVGAGDVLSYRLKADAPAGPATVALTIRDNGGTTGGAVDSLRRTFTITVNAPPVITITSDKGGSISKGDIVKLTATGGSTYEWTTADGIISGQRTPVLEVRPMTNTSYEVTAISATGCTATGSFALSVVADFKVDAVNILTPNGDGRNDRWVVRNLDSYPDNEVKIYDRAGRLIYSRRNYSNDWDGTLNGSPLAEGTYYYILTIQNGARAAKGYVTIIRDRY